MELEDEWWEKIDYVENLVRASKNGIDMVFCPGAVDHDETCLTQGVRIVVHEYAACASSICRGG